MAKKYGRCANYGECTLADSHNTIESTEENFVCTECGKPLRVVANAGEEENKFKKIFQKIRKWLLPFERKQQYGKPCIPPHRRRDGCWFC